MPNIEPAVNIPLLRKAIEWAEAEAAKPWELSEWNQGWWMSEPALVRPSYDLIDAGLARRDQAKAPECGTCYCIAGFVAAETQNVHDPFLARDTAADALGLDEDQADELFDGGNNIADVRRVAESIAGERL